MTGPHQSSDRLGPGTIEYVDGSGWRYRAPSDTTAGPFVVAAGDGDYVLPSDNPSRFIIVTLDVSDVAATDGTCTGALASLKRKWLQVPS